MKGKVEIRRWDVLDIFYHEEDRDAAVKLMDEYISKGWTLETDGDIAGNDPYDESSQLMKLHRIRTVKLKQQP
jgi:hypothetical protein